MICERSTKKVCTPCKKKRAYQNQDKTIVAEQARTYRKENQDKLKQYNREYYAENKEKSLAASKEYRNNHKNELRQKNKAWREANQESQRAKMLKKYAENADSRRENKRKERANWTQERRDRHNAYLRNRHPEVMKNAQTKLRHRLRSRMLHALKDQRCKKKDPTSLLAGCRISELKRYLELQFKPGMTWDNIHIDHIIPCASYDLTDVEQQRRCFHFTNLQPLLAVDNMRKGASINLEDDIFQAIYWLFEESEPTCVTEN